MESQRLELEALKEKLGIAPAATNVLPSHQQQPQSQSQSIGGLGLMGAHNGEWQGGTGGGFKKEREEGAESI